MGIMPALTGNVYEMANRNKGLDIKTAITPGKRYQEYQADKQEYNEIRAKQLGIELPKNSTTVNNGTAVSPFEERIQSALDTVRLWRGPDYVFTNAESKVLETLLSGSDNPDEVLSRFIASSSLAGMSGYDVKTVYDNLDQIAQYYTGKDYMPNDSTFFDKIQASFKTIQAQRVMAQYKDAYISGDYDKASEYEAKAQALLDEIGDVMTGVPQSTLDALATTVLEQTGYIYDVMQSGGLWSMATTAALTGLIALSGLNPISAGIATAAMPIFVAGAAKIGSFFETTTLAEAQSFWDLMHDPETPANPGAANVLSLLNGLFVGATETFLDGISSRGLNKIGGKKLNQLGVSMLVDSFATRGSNRFAYSLLDWVTGGVDEALLNEFPQQVWDYMTGVAYRHMSGVPTGFDFNEMMSESFKAAADGLLVGLVYGSAGIPSAMRDYKSLSLELRRQANKTYSREVFFDSTKDMKPEGMSSAAYQEAQSKIWDASVIQREEYMAKNYAGTVMESMEVAQEELFVKTDADGNPKGVPDGSINRTSQGRLYAQEIANPIETTVYFGDQDQKTYYGSVSFSERADTIKINSVRVSQGYESLRPEMLTQVFSDYGFNKTIEWNPITKGLQAVKQSLIDNNPDKTGLNYKAYSTKANTQTLADDIQKNMPSLTRPEALVSAQLYLMADRGALSANNNGMIFGDAAADGVNLGGRRGATNIAKSLIYAAKDADVSTFTHELFHATAAVRPTEKHELTEAVRNAANDEKGREQLKRFIEDHKQIWGGKLDIEGVMKSFENITDAWTRTQEEDLARLYEAYRSSTQSQRDSLPQKIKDALRRLADYINRVYRELKDTVPLNEDITKAFDRLTGVEKTSSATKKPSSTGIVYQSRNPEDYPSRHFTDNQEYLETEKELRSNPEIFDEEGYPLASNGERSNLPWEQYVLVRTPAFKNWFGDWEADPENASKIVDENGEPRIVYHGTYADFNIFDRTKIRANMDIQGNFFSPWEEDAQGYGPNIRAFFLNIRNPANERQGYGSLNKFKGQNYAGVKARDYLISLGYDGVNNSDEEYIAFESSQIKSATDNEGTFSADNPNIFFQDANSKELDSRYMEAVENGDIGTARQMVQERADAMGFSNAIPEQTEAYTIRTKPAPKKTIKVYKTFTVDEQGYPTALFVAGTARLPRGVWIDAVDTYHFTASNGRKYIPSTKNPNTAGGTTGASVAIPNEEVRQELIARGYLSASSKAKAITALAYRPGWHAGDEPFFPQGGIQDVEYLADEKAYVQLAKDIQESEGISESKAKALRRERYGTFEEWRGEERSKAHPYKNLHRYNQVVFECEMSADTDYTQTEVIKSGENKGKIRYSDRQEMPSDGSYKYATNPMTKTSDKGTWYISGSLKIIRPLTQQEANSILIADGFMPQAWEGGIMDLEALDVQQIQDDAARKTLAPITYDDNGNVIPLSQRFNAGSPDVRYQDEFDRTRYSGLFRRADEPASETFDPTTPQQAANAADYMSPPDYPDFYDVPDDGEYFDDLIDPAKWDSLVKPEDLGIKQDADYTKLPIENQMGYTYEEAVAATLPDVRYVGSDSAKDAQFIEAMDDPNTFYRYMYLLGESLNLNRNGKNGYKPFESSRVQIEPYADQNHREVIQAMTNARVSNVDVRKVAKAWNMGQEVNPARVEIARKQIKKYPRIWRDFFADLTGNKDMKPGTLIEGRLDVQAEAQGNWRSVDELAKIANEAGFADVEAKLRSGSLKMNDIDNETLAKLKDQVKVLRRQYDSTTRNNEKLNTTIKDLKAAIAENEKEKEAIDKKINGVIRLLNENVSYEDQKTISPEYVQLSKELHYLEHGYDEIWNTYYKPTDGRTARGQKKMDQLKSMADAEWRKGAKDDYGLNNLNEIKARIRELKDRLKEIRLNYAVDVARSIRNRTGKLNSQLAKAKETIDGYKSSAVENTAQIDQLNFQISSLQSQLKEQERIADLLRKSENVELARLQREVADLKRNQANFSDQMEKTIGRMEADYEAMVRRAQKQRDQIIEKQRQQRGLEEIRAEKASLAKMIMEPVNLQTTDWETGGQAIMAIQAMIDPEFRRDWIYALDANLKGEAKKGTMTIPEAQNYFAHLDDAGRQAVIDALSPQVIARLTGERKPLNDWTVDELREMANEVYMLRKLGRDTLKAKNAFLQEQAKYITKSMLETLRPLAGKNLKNLPGSQEALQHAKDPKVRISQLIYSSRRPQELVQLIDGGYGNKGPAYNLLIDEKRYHQNRALKKMDERFSVIDPLITKETAEKLAKTHRIDFGDGYVHTFTLDDLAYIWLSQYEAQNRAAVAFGTLITQEEKGTGIPRGLDENGRPAREYLTHSVIADDEALERTGWDRYKIALNEAHLALEEAGLMDFVSAIEKDLNGQGERLQKMMVTTFNQPIHLVEHYLPIRRKDLTGENLDLSADAILNYGNSTVMHNPEKGFTIQRVNVPPRQQTPVNTSLLSVWRNSVRQQEWLIESAAYIKKLHRIFNNKEFQNALQGAYNAGLYREITDYIDLIANPYKQPRKTGAEKTFRALRGNLAAAYLGWKVSGIITQGITSPMPFLSDVSPARLIKAYMDIAQDYSIISEIDEKSPMMKHRSMSFVVEELAQRILEAGNNKAIENWYKFTQTGMKGLEWIDRVATAGGWLAKYQEELESGINKGLDTETAETAAIKAADDLVLKVQPTGDKTEYASMFRTESEFAKAILQFTTSLNVIWNNITADLQGYLRNKEYGKIVGTLAGYGLAGLLLGVALTGFDDDDEPVDKARKIGYFTLTQFMDSVPWIGSMINEAMQHIITGERDFYGTSSLFPAANELLQTVDALATGDFAKGLEKLVKGIGLATGVPTSMLTQVKNAIVDADPWKLLGR